MSTWKPISTAPKDRPIDLWATEHGLCGNCKWDSEDEMWIEQGSLLISAATHWKEPDKGPGQEEGCENFHHSLSDRHSAIDPCVPHLRFVDAEDAAMAAIAKHQEGQK